MNDEKNDQSIVQHLQIQIGKAYSPCGLLLSVKFSRLNVQLLEAKYCVNFYKNAITHQSENRIDNNSIIM